jgi:hypothetical protein
MSIGIFFGFLLLLPVLTIILPKQSFSEVENRSLSEMPEFNAISVMSRDFMNGTEDFLSDHFAARSSWIGIKTDIELLSGKSEVNNVFILENRLVERTPQPDYQLADLSIQAINDFAEKYSVPTFVMIAPTSGGIYMDELPENSGSFNQKTLIDYVYNGLDNENVTALNAYSALYATRDEYIYYRTDHHWTTLGAYYAYSSTIKKMGFTPVSLGKFDIEHASHSFKGTLYSKVLYDEIEDDVIDYYYNKSSAKVMSVIVGEGEQAEVYDSLYFREYLAKKDKYSSFTGPNQPLINIKTDSLSGKKLLLIKDSYAHCFVPFLVQHYSEIEMLDLRYINSSIENYVDVSSYDQVLFLYNATSFAEDENIKKLGL